MSETPKKLFLLDAFALIYRAYFAFNKNPRYSSKGLNTSAILGFTNSLLDVLNKEKPSHMAVVFDTAAPTIRHVDFTEYKANRESQPEDITLSIPYIKRIIEGFRIPIMFSDGYEADDVIGTLAKKAEKEGFITYMMTPDKDFGQLVSENIFIYKPARMGNGAEVMGIKEVCEKFSIISPLQVIDILGMMGDAVDNIPGIPGVGEKTAKALVAEFGSMENLLNNTHKLKGKLKENVEANVDKAIMSKSLATIILDAPVDLHEESLRIEEPDKEILKELFTELEFRTLGKRLFGMDFEVSMSKVTSAGMQIDLFDSPEVVGQPIKSDESSILNTIENTSHNYILVDSVAKRKELIDLLTSQSTFVFDSETTSLDVMEAELVGLSFAIKKAEAYYVPVPENHNEAQQLMNEFKAVFEHSEIEKVGQNIKYDIAVLSNYGIEVKGKLFDTMIAHYLLEPDQKHNMNSLAQNYLNYDPVSIETLIGKKGKGQGSMRDVELESIKEYASEDADITYQLKSIFSDKLKQTNTEKLFNEIETPLIPVLVNMETEGVKVDINTLSDFSKLLESDIIEIETSIQELAGTRFNISSPKQVGDILFEVLKITEKPKKTKTGQYSTGEDVLSKLVGKHPIVEKILDYRELQKLKNTYVDSLPLLINKKTGKIHTSYNQTVAATGRLSSINPNLQNIPIKTERGREVRKAFVPGNENNILVSADYSQIELRLIAALSKDEAMLEAFRQGQDIHSSTAAKIYGIDLDEVTRDMRRNAKMVNFGIIYGISAFGLSERLNIPRKEAAEIIDQYFLKFPGIKEYMNKTVEFARQNGYVETIMGRKRYIRDINDRNAVVRGFAERNAINSPIQGSAADMIKIAMINIHKDFKDLNLKSKMVLQVHDELVFDAAISELELIKPIISTRMKNTFQLDVPIEIEIGSGKNWLEAH